MQNFIMCEEVLTCITVLFRQYLCQKIMLTKLIQSSPHIARKLLASENDVLPHNSIIHDTY